MHYDFVAPKPPLEPTPCEDFKGLFEQRSCLPPNWYRRNVRELNLTRNEHAAMTDSVKASLRRETPFADPRVAHLSVKLRYALANFYESGRAHSSVNIPALVMPKSGEPYAPEIVVQKVGSRLFHYIRAKITVFSPEYLPVHEVILRLVEILGALPTYAIYGNVLASISQWMINTHIGCLMEDINDAVTWDRLRTRLPGDPPPQEQPLPAPAESSLGPVSYTHLTLPTICSV